MGVLLHWGDYIRLFRPLCALALVWGTAQSQNMHFEAIQTFKVRGEG